MFYLKSSLRAWNTNNFIDIFKNEISSLDTNLLPLQQGLSSSSYAVEDNVSISVLKVDNDDNNIHVKAGLFYTGIIAGCNCADDPSPVNENNEYCEVLFTINRKTAETAVTIIS